MLGWWREAPIGARRALVGAGVGWMLDAMDIMLYAFALPEIRSEFGLTSAGAGALVSVTLVAASLGGIAFGVLADRHGRARTLVLSILTYSIFTAMTATAGSVGQLVLWRVLVGIGLGGEWSAGSVLVAESWPAAHRGKAIGLMQSGWAAGYLLAALLAAAILPRWGWRPLFAVGVLPALLAVWLRRRLEEPPRAAPPPERSRLATIFRPPLLRTTVIASSTTTALLFAYWGLFTWVPTYLATPAAGGGAGLDIVKSTAWIVPMQLGAMLGYVLFGVISDRLGRKPTFLAFVLGAAVLVPVYGWSARSEWTLLLLGPLLGFFGHGYFSVFGALLAELYPSSVRGTAQGFCYNVGRAASAAAPWVIGGIADRAGVGSALAVTSLGYLAGAVVFLALPETKGRDLA